MPQIDENLFTVEDLRTMELIKKDGRPTDNMTDSLWQLAFKDLQANNVPFSDGEHSRMKFKHSKTFIDDKGNYMEDETTQWQRYCMFINSALEDIRDGRITYCFYLNQIRVLLRFHPTLKTKYQDFYWEVWLEK